MFHLHVRYTSRDGGRSCDAARQYIAREGRYCKRGDTVRWVRSIHMPPWAQGHSAPAYWQAAEGRNSRVNARTAILLEFALPKQLSRAEQDALLMEMAERLAALGLEHETVAARLPVTLALHEGYWRNPHGHVLLSTSLNDGILRNEGTWFRRYGPARPTEGGARRSQYVTKRRWIHRVRKLWADLANAALARCGLQPVLDHRSHANRGLGTQGQIHLGPRIAKLFREGIDTVRGARSRAIDEANEAAAALEAQVLQRRQQLCQAEFEEHACVQDERRWRAQQEAEWIELLRHHPLTGSRSSLEKHASAVVIESDRSNMDTVSRALELYPNVKAFAQALGPEWEAVATPEGFWAARPGSDKVVLLGRGYVATDGQDQTYVRALLAAVPLLQMKAPLMIVADSVKGAAQSLLGEIGAEWRLVSWKGRLARKAGADV